MAQKKILIIEDDQSLVKLLDQSLESKNYKIILALDAEAGYKKAKSEKPNLIILDIILPGKDGFACLKQLKEDKAVKTIPVIILSNLGQTEEIRKGLALGAVDYLVKADFTINEVAMKILKHLK